MYLNGYSKQHVLLFLVRHFSDDAASNLKIKRIRISIHCKLVFQCVLRAALCLHSNFIGLMMKH